MNVTCDGPNKCGGDDALKPPPGMVWVETTRKFQEGDAWCFTCQRKFKLAVESSEEKP